MNFISFWYFLKLVLNRGDTFYTRLTLATVADWWVTCHAGCHRGVTKSTRVDWLGSPPAVRRSRRCGAPGTVRLRDLELADHREPKGSGASRIWSPEWAPASFTTAVLDVDRWLPATDDYKMQARAPEVHRLTVMLDVCSPTSIEDGDDHTISISGELLRKE
jgi:hypothetical protein